MTRERVLDRAVREFAGLLIRDGFATVEQGVVVTGFDVVPFRLKLKVYVP